jgi:hypothetical protein
VRAVLAEDLFLLRDGLVRLLEAHDFEIAAAVEDSPCLLQALLEHRPDVAVVNVRLPPTFTDDGLRVALEARRQVPGQHCARYRLGEPAIDIRPRRSLLGLFCRVVLHPSIMLDRSPIQRSTALAGTRRHDQTRRLKDRLGPGQSRPSPSSPSA